MAIIHRTTLTPTKMELLSGWLPTRPWYLGTAGTAEPVKVGGFRLDDPDGEVGAPGELAVTISRVLDDGAAQDGHGYVTAPWRRPDGSTVRSVFATATLR